MPTGTADGDGDACVAEEVGVASSLPRYPTTAQPPSRQRVRRTVTAANVIVPGAIGIVGWLALWEADFGWYLAIVVAVSALCPMVDRRLEPALTTLALVVPALMLVPFTSVDDNEHNLGFLLIPVLFVVMLLSWGVGEAARQVRLGAARRRRR